MAFHLKPVKLRNFFFDVVVSNNLEENFASRQISACN